MKQTKITIIFSLAALLLIFTGCNKKEAVYSTMAVESPKMAKVGVAASRASEAKINVVMDFDDAFIEEEAMDAMAPEPNVERKLIKTGNLSVEVESLSEIENTINDFAKAFGGYVTNSSTYEYGYNATIKVPAARFEEAMNVAGDFGKIKNRSVNSQDVTEEFYDLRTRLDTKKIMQKKLEGYLSNAKDIKDLLEIERQLNNVTSEIESMEGRIKRLSNQIDYSTIYFSCSLPTGFAESGFEWPDLGDGFREFGSNVVNFMAGLLMVIFYIIIFGIPILAVLGFFFWLLFGRVGLLIKLFKWLKWKK